MKQVRQKFTGVDYACPRQQPWRVWWKGDIIAFAATEEEAKAKLEREWKLKQPAGVRI